MAGGRPTKYKKKYCKEIIEFFDREPEGPRLKRTFYANGVLKSEEPITEAKEFPTFQGFAKHIGVSMSRLTEWRDKYPEFQAAYTRAKEIQEGVWLSESMAGRYNAQFAKFFGVNCLGYKDKVEQETTITDFRLRFDNMAEGESEDISG